MAKKLCSNETEPLTDDEKLAGEFLVGKIERTPKGEFSHRWLTGDEEQAALAALVRVLRDWRPLRSMFRFRLASLFDPQGTDERKLIIGLRHGEKGPRHMTAIAIAHFIAEQITNGNKVELAQEAAAKHFTVSSSTVTRAWRDHKDSLLIRPIWQAGRTIN